MSDVSDQEPDYDEDRLFDQASWEGVSCVSYLWPYTQRPEVFETRRAIANLTYGLRYAVGASVLGDHDEVSVADVLAFVKTADDVRKAADVALNEVVAEAIARGASWAQIGNALGILRTAAHKRFSKRLSDRRRTELKDEATGCMMLYAYWTGQISAESLGFDSSYWEAATIETAIDYAVRIAIKAGRLHMEYMTEAGEGPTLEELYRVYDLVRQSMHIMMVPEALKAFARYSNVHDPWADANAQAYFVRAACNLVFTFNHFGKLWHEIASADNETLKRRVAYIHRNLLDVTYSLGRPECVFVLAKIEKEVVKTGNTLYMEKRKDEGVEYSQMEIFEAVWRKDKVKMAEILGVAEVADMPSLDDLLDC